MSQVTSDLSSMENPTSNPSISKVESVTPCTVKNDTDTSVDLKSIGISQPSIRQNPVKSSTCYFKQPYAITLPSSPHPVTSMPYKFSTASGCNHGFIDNSETNYVDVVSFSGGPILTSITNPADLTACQQEPLELSYTPILSPNNTPITFIQGLTPNLSLADSSNNHISPRMWTGGPYVGTYLAKSVVSPPNTPLSHSQPLPIQYLGGGGPQDLSFDNLSIGQGMDDSLSTYDGSSVMPWASNQEADVYSISPHYVIPPRHVMVTSSPHFAACPPMYHWPSPGPPIQMTPSNKGPDGANLFVFHIPNHFSNADLWNLFRPYGNVVSVRIMIEKDTGRSRGFGFVSYDLPESAEQAIKNLNGYAIGNKRLKVQHKQVRPSDNEHAECLQQVSSLSLNQGEGIHDSNNDLR